MICLVFTKTKLLAGVSLKSPDLLTIKGNSFIEYGNKSMAEVLKLHLSDIKYAYATYARKNGSQPEASIPTAIAFPDDLTINKKSTETRGVMKVLEVEKKNFQLLHTDQLGLSYLHSLTKDKTMRKEPCILLNALDDHLDLYYLNTNGKFNGSTFVELKDMGVAIGRKNLLKELSAEFKKAGISIDEKDKKQLELLSVNPPKNFVFELKKSSGPVHIQAQLTLTPRRYEEIVSINRTNLGGRLNQAKLEAQGIKKVVLMGEFLNNSVLKDYFDKELQISSKLLTLNNRASTADYKAIVSGLASRTKELLEAERKQKEEAERKRREEEARKRREEAERKRREEEERKRKARLEAERKRKEEEERRRKEAERKRKEEEARKRKEEAERKRIEAEKKAKEQRDTFIRTLQQNCTNPSKQKEYEARYIKEGAKFNIPKEVITWTIQETLSNLQLHGKQTPVSLTPSVPTIVPSVQTPAVGVDKNLMRLYDLFDVEAVLIDAEFSTKKVTQIDSGAKKIIRIIDVSSMSNPELLNNFKKLYKKELTYYKALSEIHTVQEGMYYSRDFVESFHLKEYIHKIGLDKKTRVEQLKSSDLKLLLQVFREVSTLKVSHANLDEDNIHVVANRKWTLQRDIEIRFSGFTSQEITQEEMEKKLHTLFGKLIDENVYANFRKKFNI